MSSLASSYSRYMLARADYMAKQDEFIGLVEMPHRFVGAYFGSVRAQVAARFEQLIRPFSILRAASAGDGEEDEARQAQRISDVYTWLIEEINTNESRCNQSLLSRLKQSAQSAQSAPRGGSAFETGACFYPSPSTTSSENDCAGDRDANANRPFSFDFDKEIESAKALLLDNQSFVFVESDHNGFGTLFEFKDRYLSVKERLFLESSRAFTNQSNITPNTNQGPHEKFHFIKAFWIDPSMRIEDCIDLIEDSLNKPVMEFRMSPSDSRQVTTTSESPEDEEPVQQDSQIKSEPCEPSESRINDDLYNHQQTEPCLSGDASMATEREPDEFIQPLVQLAENRSTKIPESSSVEKRVVDSQMESESTEPKSQRSGELVSKTEPISAAEKTIYLSSDDESESEAENHSVSLPKSIAKLRKVEASDSDLNENEMTAQEREVYDAIPADYKNIAMASNAFAFFKPELVVWADWNKKQSHEKYFWPAKIVSKLKHRRFRWTVKFYEAPQSQEEQELERSVDGFSIRLFFTKNHFEFKAKAATARNFEICYQAALGDLGAHLKLRPIKSDQLELIQETMSNNECEAYEAFQRFLSRVGASEKSPSDFRPGLVVWANWNSVPMKSRFMWPAKIVERVSHSNCRVQFYQVPENKRNRSTNRLIPASNIRLFFDKTHFGFKEQAAKSDNFDCCFQAGLRDLKNFLVKETRRL